jgi:hypothetical protein
LATNLLEHSHITVVIKALLEAKLVQPIICRTGVICSSAEPKHLIDSCMQKDFVFKNVIVYNVES